MTTISFEGMPTSALVSAYNYCAQALGSPEVTRFSDRASAERRTRFILSQIVDPAKRPAPFNEVAPLPGGARTLDAMKGDVRAKDVPHPYIKSVTNGGITPGELFPDKVSREPLVTADKTPTPPVAGKTPRWRKPKRTEPQKIAYRPRPGSDQAAMYALLTRPQGVTAEDFCAEMAKLTSKPTMLKVEQTWSNIGYLFVTLKGYGLDFDGTTFRLLVPADERDSVKGAK